MDGDHAMETPLNQHGQNIFVRVYGFLICAGSNLQSTVLLALRLTWGWQLAESGWSHLHDVDTMVKRFIGWHIPFPTANVYLSGSMELIGGTLLIVGLGTRLISLPLVFNFIVAYATASKDTFRELLHGMLRTGYDDFINDAAFPMLMLALIMLAFGPGKASMDYLLQRTLFHRRDQPRGFPMDV
jgi:putative oxidoreductase